MQRLNLRKATITALMASVSVSAHAQTPSRTACDGMSGGPQLDCIEKNYPRVFEKVEVECSAQPRGSRGSCRKAAFAAKGISFTPAGASNAREETRSVEQSNRQESGEAEMTKPTVAVVPPQEVSPPTPEHPSSVVAGATNTPVSQPALTEEPVLDCTGTDTELPPETVENILASDTMRAGVDLGQFYTRDFRPLKKWIPLSPQQRANAAGLYTDIASTCERLDQSISMRASAHLWGIANGEASADGSQQFAACYTHQATRLHRLDREPSADEAPDGAFYYVSSIIEGRMYELIMSGSERSIAAQMEAAQVGAGVKVSGSATSTDYRERRRVKGLTPSGKSVLSFASTNAQDLASNFTEDGATAPIRYTLTAIPSVYTSAQARYQKCQAAARQQALAFLEQLHTTQSFDVVLVSVQMADYGWDAMADGSAPDPRITISANPRTPQNSPPPFYYSDKQKVLVNRPLGVLELGQVSPLHIRLEDDDSPLSPDYAGSVDIVSIESGTPDGRGNTCFYTEGSEHLSTVCLKFKKVSSP